MLKFLVRQRRIVILISLFLALVLFNTSYMSLGTIVPSFVMLLTICDMIYESQCLSFRKPHIPLIIFAYIVLLSTLFSTGNIDLESLKVFILAIYVTCVSSVILHAQEVKFIGIILVLSYLVYAFLVLFAIGGDSNYYGRVQISILHSSIPLDPNVVAAVFVLPFILCLYNLFYGKYKIFFLGSMLFFFMAIVASASRGAMLSIVIASVLLLVSYFLNQNVKFINKLLIVIGLLILCSFIITYLTFNFEFAFQRMFEMDINDNNISNGRFPIWKDRMNAIMNSPIIGYGSNYNIGEYKGVRSHNTYIQVLQYSGFIGFFLFFSVLYYSFKKLKMPFLAKSALYVSVLLPVFFIDQLQERIIWNFILFSTMLSYQDNVHDILLWKK